MKNTYEKSKTESRPLVLAKFSLRYFGFVCYGESFSGRISADGLFLLS